MYSRHNVLQQSNRSMAEPRSLETFIKSLSANSYYVSDSDETVKSNNSNSQCLFSGGTVLAAAVDAPIKDSYVALKTEAELSQLDGSTTTAGLRHSVANSTEEEPEHLAESKRADLLCNKMKFDVNNVVTSTSQIHDDSEASAEGAGTQTFQQTFPCAHCEKRFVRVVNLNAHLRVAHRRNVDDDEKERPFACKKCKQRFKYRHHLLQHRVVHTGVKRHRCNVCKKLFNSQSSLNVHVRSLHSGEKRFRCQHCSIKFTEQEKLSSHIAKHHVEGLFQCETCERKYFKLSSLNRHAITHTTLPSLLCTECPAKFYYAHDLKSHKLARHSNDEKPLICTTCKKSFKTQQCLRLHMKTHSGIVFKECPKCQRWFRTQPGYASHACVKNSETFRCDQCQREFRLAAHLRRHKIRKHNAALSTRILYCEHCSKSFINKCELERHTRTHSGERPFVCVKCEMRFMQRSHLDRHIVSHMKKEYSCEKCGREFLVEKSLLAHVAYIHGDRQDSKRRKDSTEKLSKTSNRKSSK